MSQELSFTNFDLASFGHLNVPAQPLRFGFQVDIVPAQFESPHLLFGLTSRLRTPDGQTRSVGFAVRVDLTNGE
ncbi:MAG TPA: hypothetical protein VD994_10330, partial [Prosthecobacter sp.]|nr:hypothetical protein [Prosthecobacter sp.]